jgi:nitrogen PTS system EIIA component
VKQEIWTMSTVSLAEFLRPENFIWNLPAPDKSAVLRALAVAGAARVPGVDEAALLDLIKRREDILSTGVGGGVALPHAMVPGLAHKTLIVCRAIPPVDYDALDDVPVDLIFLLLSAPEELKEHVRVLARLARIIGRASVLEHLRGAAGPEDAYRILAEEDARRV